MADQTIDLLNRFNIQADKIWSYKDFFRPVEYNLNIQVGVAAKITKSVMDERDWLPVLVAFRGVYMDRGMSFKEVATAILEDERFESQRERVKEWLDAWDKGWDPSHNTNLVIGVDHQNFDTVKIFHIWLNEGYMHPENFRPGSRKGLDALKISPIIEGHAHFLLITFLQKVSKFIVEFNYQIVKPILKEYNT